MAASGPQEVVGLEMLLTNAAALVVDTEPGQISLTAICLAGAHRGCSRGCRLIRQGATGAAGQSDLILQEAWQPVNGRISIAQPQPSKLLLLQPWSWWSI